MESIQTQLWQEEAEADNPYATKTAYCSGYDVYGEMLGQCRWVEMLYLLFKREAPSQEQANLLEKLAVMLANAGPRDSAVHAAMCGGVGKSVAASSLMAALAVGAGQYSGAREVFLILSLFDDLGLAMEKWERFLVAPALNLPVSTWPDIDHIPGFDPYGQSTPTSIVQSLDALCTNSGDKHLQWLKANISPLETAAGKPITLLMVAAAAFIDLGFTAKEAEMLTLILRLPGAAAHSLEQEQSGHKKFPFYPLELETE